MSEDLAPTWVVGSIDLTDYPFSVDRENTVDIGEPEMVVESIVSQLADGDLERTVRYGNRTYVIPIYIEGPTLADVADAEALLRAELRRDGLTLTHNPGDSWAVDSVYEVQTAKMTPSRDDTHESHLIRKWTLTLTCGPFARSADLVTVDATPAPAGSPTTVTINNADTTTGWSAVKTDNAGVASTVTVTDEGLFVQATASGIRFHLDLIVTSASTSTAVTPYLQVEMSGDTPSFFYATLNGVETLLTPAVTRAMPSGTVLYLFGTGGLAFTKFRARKTQSSYTPTVSTMRVHDVTLTDTVPQVSPRQITRIIEVGGTERTPASIHVQSAGGSAALTQVMVHTCPEDGSGYSPPLRRWRTGDSTGPETTDATLYSGKYEPIAFASGGFYAEVPTSALPEGGYTLLARVRLAASAPANVTVFYSTSTLYPGSTIQDGYVNGSEIITLTDTNWTLVDLGALSLPSVRTQAGKVQIVLQTSTTHAQVYLDEAWLFREDDDCALTITNTPLPHLWLDSPNSSSPVERVWIGDGLDTRVHPSAGLVAQGRHVLSPEGTAAFTAALSDNPTTDATFYRRWHSNAAE